MSETSISKRRHSTPPSPLRSDPAGDTTSQTTERPPRKKAKRKALQEDPQEERPTSHELPQPSNSKRYLPAEAGTGQYSPKPSNQTTSFPSRDVLEAQVNQTRAAQPPTPSQGTMSGPGMTIPGGGLKISQSGLAQEHSAVPASDTSAFIEGYVFDAMSLPPSSLPPVRMMESPELSFVSNPQVNAPLVPTTSMASAYPDISSEMEIGVYGEQLQQQQSSISSFPLTSQQAYLTTTETGQTSHTQAPASEIPAYMAGGVQQAHFSATNFMPARGPPWIDPNAPQRPSSAQLGFPQQMNALPVQTGVFSYQPGNPPSEAPHSTTNPQRKADPYFAQQAHSSYGLQSHPSPPSTPPGALQRHQPLYTPSRHPESTTSWTAPTTHQQTFMLQPSDQPQQNPFTAQLHNLTAPSPQQQGLPPITQQLTSLHDLTLPQPQSQSHVHDITPINPLILPPRDLWAQLETAQLTMVGTLLDLIRRGRAEDENMGLDAEIELEDRQVRNVTANLINVMSLWYLLRRERGWDL